MDCVMHPPQACVISSPIPIIDAWANPKPIVNKVSVPIEGLSVKERKEKGKKIMTEAIKHHSSIHSPMAGDLCDGVVADDEGNIKDKEEEY